VVQFDECTVAPLLEELGQRTNFAISGHWLEVFGLCATCRH
jgi:Fur family ferric uptake transcriptional regulator